MKEVSLDKYAPPSWLNQSRIASQSQGGPGGLKNSRLKIVHHDDGDKLSVKSLRQSQDDTKAPAP